MLGLAPEIIVFDTEYTTWEGAQERDWSGPGEHREIVEIGAVRIETDGLVERGALDLIVRPRLDPALSEYFITLTGITQERVDREGIDFANAIQRFAEWCGVLSIYAWGRDHEVLSANCRLIGTEFPFADVSQFHDARDMFREAGIPAEDFMSSTIIRAFGKEPVRRGHSGLNDARTIVDAMRELAARGNRA